MKMEFNHPVSGEDILRALKRTSRIFGFRFVDSQINLSDQSYHRVTLVKHRSSSKIKNLDMDFIPNLRFHIGARAGEKLLIEEGVNYSQLTLIVYVPLAGSRSLPISKESDTAYHRVSYEVEDLIRAIERLVNFNPAE